MVTDLESRNGALTRRRHMAGVTAHEHLLQAASELFYREGVRAVGIDAVVERAGVNKMSLYRQFDSKEALVIAYLERMDAAFWRRFETSLAKQGGSARQQLQQLFEDLAARCAAPGYRGCAFINVLTEFADPTHPLRRLAEDHKMRLNTRLFELATAAGASNAKALGSALALLAEGTYTASQTYGPDSDVVNAAPGVARLLIESACGPLA